MTKKNLEKMAKRRRRRWQREEGEEVWQEEEDGLNVQKHPHPAFPFPSLPPVPSLPPQKGFIGNTYQAGSGRHRHDAPLV